MTFNNLITCLDEPCYYLGDCAEDMIEKCMDEYLACFHGDMNCIEIYLAMLDCPPGQEAYSCTSKVRTKGTIEAQKSWMAIVDCLETSGYFECPEDDENCLNDAWMMCDEVIKDCLHGPDTCSSILECLESPYAADPIYYQSCVLWGTIEAQNLYQAVVDCVIGECGETPDSKCKETAYAGTCSGALTVCLADN